MPLEKIEVIIDWEEPHNAYDVSAVTWMTNYYQNFVGIFKDRLLIDTKKGIISHKELKCKIVIAIVLKLSDYERSFKVKTNAYDFSIGVLMQDDHPIEFKSSKL